MRHAGNLLLAIESDIVSTIMLLLHSGNINNDTFHKNKPGARLLRSTNTVFDIVESPGGLMIGARRNADPGYHYWRITQWLMPWYTLIPPYKGHAANGHAWVPMDDTNCMAWTMTFHPVRELTAQETEL